MGGTVGGIPPIEVRYGFDHPTFGRIPFDGNEDAIRTVGLYREIVRLTGGGPGEDITWEPTYRGYYDNLSFELKLNEKWNEEGRSYDTDIILSREGTGLQFGVHIDRENLMMSVSPRGGSYYREWRADEFDTIYGSVKEAYNTIVEKPLEEIAKGIEELTRRRGVSIGT